MIRSVIVLAASIGMSAPGANILVSNLAEPTRATTIVDSSLWAAQSFDTDANPYSLVDIMTVLGNESGTPAITAELRKDTVDGPLLTSFSVPSLAGALSVKTLLPNSAVLLNPSTSYWLILGVTGPGSFGWSYAQGNNAVGPGSLGPYSYSDDLGATWGMVGTDDPYKVRVDVNSGAVPEPSAAALSAAGLLLLIAIRWPGARRLFRT